MNVLADNPDGARTFERVLRIEWGDCDAAGIVYFPRYFALFDDCTAHAFESAGFATSKMRSLYGIVGIPTVEVRANFMAPCTFDDDVTVETRVMGWRRSSFKVHHRLLKRAALHVEAFEIRVWTVSDSTSPSGLRGRQIPPEVRAAFKSP